MFNSRCFSFSLIVRSLFLTTLNISAASPLMPAGAAETEIVQNTRAFKLELSATRIIYSAGAQGARLSVKNPQNFPVLVQSQVLNEDRKTQAPFVVTPPLFRLDANLRNTLRIIGTGGLQTGRKESLHWLCVTGIPPKDGDVWAHNSAQDAANRALLNVQVSTHMCIKLIARPANLSGSMMQAAESVHWTREGNALRAKNDSPYYINLYSLSTGAQQVTRLSYIPPFASQTFSLKDKPEDSVNWSVVTDTGGESRRFTAPI